MKINVLQISPGFDSLDRLKLQMSLTRLQAVFNSVQFRDAIINHAPFDSIFNLSNAAIYQKIMQGAEYGSPPDNEADLRLFLDYRIRNKSVGYVKNGIIYTFVNQFRNLSYDALAGHYGHEYCHLLGFIDPDILNDETRAKNVPYEVGRIVGELSRMYDYEITVG